MDLVAEAVRAIGLACNLTLVVPGLIVALLARRNAALAATSYIGAASLTRWAQTAGWIEAPDDQLAAIPVAIGLVLIIAAMVTNRNRPADTSTTTPSSASRTVAAAGPALGAGTVGVVMSLLWRPCTGEALGDAITTTIASPASGIFPLTTYLVIVCLPVVAVAALTVAVPRVGHLVAHPALTVPAALLAAVMTATLAAGSWHDLVGELYRRSGG